jgi:uncharacterized protein (DUF1697 family)
MPALKVCLERQGFASVATYIQSGNVVFATGDKDARAIAARIERALALSFGFEVPIVLQSRAQLQRVIHRAPAMWKRGAHLRRNVAFLRPPLTARRAIEDVEVKDGVDAVSAGPGVLYLSTRMDALTSSRLNRLVMKPSYKQMTLRTYNTCQKVLELMR